VSAAAKGDASDENPLKNRRTVSDFPSGENRKRASHGIVISPSHKMGGGDGVGHRGWNWHWVQPPRDYQTMIVPVNSLFNYEYWKLYWQQVCNVNPVTKVLPSLNTNWTVPKKWNPFKWRSMSASPHHQRHVTRIHGPSGLEFREKLRSRHITDFQTLSGEDAVRDARMRDRGIGPYKGKTAVHEE